MPKKDLKAAPTIFEKLNIFTENENKTRPKNSTEIPDYCIEHTPTKSEKGGALLYIPKKLLNYINRHDLNINKDEMLESVFIDTISKSNKNTIIGLYTSTQNWH